MKAFALIAISPFADSLKLIRFRTKGKETQREAHTRTFLPSPPSNLPSTSFTLDVWWFPSLPTSDRSKFQTAAVIGLGQKLQINWYCQLKARFAFTSSTKLSTNTVAMEST